MDCYSTKAGWADVPELLTKAKAHGQQISLEELKTIVSNSDKQRFAFSSDFSKIRANQGHSIQVELGLKEQVPPSNTFITNGTADRNLESIKQKGLLKGEASSRSSFTRQRTPQ
jgi:putative RNA 2'-phosphotransferase